MSGLASILEAAQEIAAIQTRIKARSAVYQPSLKEEAAQAFGKPLDAFYDLPYDEWAVTRQMFNEAQEEAFSLCRGAGIPDDLPYSEFPLYRQLMGLDPPAAPSL